ncbi:MAG: sensor histidine kinase [Nocardioides sp.]
MSARRLAFSVGGVSILVIAGQVLAADRDAEDLGLVAGIAIPYATLGALVLLGAPGHRVGRLMSAAGVVGAIQLVAMSWVSYLPLAWLAQWLWWPMLALVFGAVLVFPTGSLPSPRWRIVGWVIVVSTTLTSLLLALAAADEPRLLTESDLPLSDWAYSLLQASWITGLVGFAGFFAVIASLPVRWRATAPGSIERRQLSCLIPGGLLLGAGIVLSVQSVPGAWLPIAVGVPLGMTVAILRYRLLDIDLIVNRTIVWLVLTGLVVAAIVTIVTLLTDVLFAIDESAAAVIASGAVVFTVDPLRRVLQRAVDRLIYGDRDDPYAVIARLGEVLGHTYDPQAVLPLVTEAAGSSLQVPYVAVELDEDDRPVIDAEYGRRVPHVESFDMVAHGERVGRLLVGRRTRDTSFSRKEVALLEDVAVQAGVAAKATQLNRDLLALRDRLVADRERERLRLRRDLHDGLGPGLTGMLLQVKAAARATDPARVDGILRGLAGDLDTISGDMRRIVDELRPPALDKGLTAALQAECLRFDSDELRVTCLLEGADTELPVAVEVAAFRIVTEALTNVARHAGSRHCDVTVRRGRTLHIDVADDGCGVSDHAHTSRESGVRLGVGLSSMRERATELGGSCVIENLPGGGTAVRVELPLARATLAAARSSPHTPTITRPPSISPSGNTSQPDRNTR